MTTRTAVICRTPNCAASSVIDPAPGSGAAVVVTVTVGSGEGEVEVSLGVGVGVGESLALGSDVGPGVEGDGSGEGDTVDGQSPVPVINDEFEEAHIRPPSLRGRREPP